MVFYGVLSVCAVAGDGAKIPDAVFELRDRYGRETSVVTSPDGCASCYLIPEVEYDIRVKKAPPGWAASPVPVRVKCDRRLAIYCGVSRITELTFSVARVTKRE